MTDVRHSALPAPDAPTATPATLAEGDAVYQLIKRADIDPLEVEDAAAQTVEVTVLWQRSILHVAHLAATRNFVLTSRAPATPSPARVIAPGLAAGAALMVAGAAFGHGAVAAATAGALASAASLGAGVAAHQRNERARTDTSRFVMDTAALGADEVSVVINDAGGTRFVFLPGAQGEVEIAGEKRPLDVLIERGHARPSPAVPGAYEVAVVAGGRYRMDLGALAITARVVASGRRVAGRGRSDRRLTAAGAGSLVAVGALLGAMRLASGYDGFLSGDDHDAEMRELRSFVLRQEAREEETPRPTATAPAGATGAAHEGAAGAMGRRDAPAQDRRYEIRRRDDHAHLTNQPTAREQVADRGVFRALGGPGGLRAPSTSGMQSPFGEMTASGDGERDLDGHMNGAQAGEADGYGGLDSTGTGIGGGGDGQGTVGTGRLGTQGHGNCPPGQQCGFGTGVARLHAPPRATGGPRVRPSAPEVLGISPDVIRRVVLRNIGQVNRCYEQGLSANPQLAGRVSISFVIANTGSVLASSVAQDNLGMPAVSACIAEAVHRWNFPVPESSGTIRVTYPFALMPQDP